jgi:uncharacterized protein YxjI
MKTRKATPLATKNKKKKGALPSKKSKPYTHAAVSPSTPPHTKTHKRWYHRFTRKKNSKKEEGNKPPLTPSQQAVTGEVTAHPTSATLVERPKLFPWRGTDFDVKDDAGRILFSFVGKAYRLMNVIVVKDKDGNKIAVVQQKFKVLRSQYQIFRYTPNCDGQSSTETDEGTPLFRFAVITLQMSSPILLKLTYRLYNGNEAGDVVMAIKRKFGLTRHYTITNAAKETIGTVKQTSVFQFNVANTYALNVVPKNDLLGCAILGIVADTITDV